MKARKKTTRRPGAAASARDSGKRGVSRAGIEAKSSPIRAGTSDRGEPSRPRKGSAPSEPAALDSATLEDADRFLKRHRSLFAQLRSR